MSAYGHQMEREFSVQSLSSRGGSEMGSRYQYVSGFYMTSFAATVFIAGLVTVGILLITLLIALAVMLQSCQSQHSGVIQSWKAHHTDDYCKIFVLQAEINKWEADEYPSVCNAYIVRYTSEGQYARDLNFIIWMAEGYFSSITPLDNKLGVVLMDIDDIFPSSSKFSSPLSCVECIEVVVHLKRILILRLYNKLRASGWPLMLLTRKSGQHRNSTTNYLSSEGYIGWSSLIMRSDDEMSMNNYEYFSRRRAMLEKEGFHIIGIISSHMDALTGPNVGKRVFKLPNPIFPGLQHQHESKQQCT
ncbi:hypothetical protein Ancab_005885 [Ancistrocladus abbreviatus]